MKAVVDSVTGVLRSPMGVALETCASFVGRLAAFPALRPHAGKLLRLLDNAANSTGAAAAAAGAVVAMASAEDVRALATVMRARFLDYDGNRSPRPHLALVPALLLTTFILFSENFVRTNFFKFLHAVAEKSPEILKTYSKELLPLVFLAMHRPDADCKYAAFSNNFFINCKEVRLALFCCYLLYLFSLILTRCWCLTFYQSYNRMCILVIY